MIGVITKASSRSGNISGSRPVDSTGLEPIQNENFIELKRNSGLNLRIDKSKIIAIETNCYYTVLYTQNEEIDLKRYRPSELMNKLGEEFAVCSNTYIINGNYIERVSGRDKKIKMKNKDMWIDFNYSQNVKLFDFLKKWTQGGTANG